MVHKQNGAPTNNTSTYSPSSRRFVQDPRGKMERATARGKEEVADKSRGASFG